MSGIGKTTAAALALAALTGAVPAAEGADGDIQRHVAVIGNRNHRERDKRTTEEQVLAAIEELGKSGSGEAVEPLMKLMEDRRAVRPYGIAAIEALAELGAKADKNIPHILVHEFVSKRGGPNHDKRNPIRLAGIDALVKIGPSAVPDVIKMLGIPRERTFNWNSWGQAILRELAKHPKCVDAMGPALINVRQGRRVQAGIHFCARCHGA